MIDNEKLDSFYIPTYGPSEKELREIIEAEGSFSIDEMTLHECVDQNVIVTPETVVLALRAVLEPIIVQHFGLSTDAMDEFTRIMVEKLSNNEVSPLDGYPSKLCAFVATSLTRRT
jgi:jasmonate O-methyltransferase